MGERCRCRCSCSPAGCCSRGWRRGGVHSQRRCGGWDQAHHAVEARVRSIAQGIVALLAGDLDVVSAHRSQRSLVPRYPGEAVRAGLSVRAPRGGRKEREWAPWPLTALTARSRSGRGWSFGAIPFVARPSTRRGAEIQKRRPELWVFHGLHSIFVWSCLVVESVWRARRRRHVVVFFTPPFGHTTIPRTHPAQSNRPTTSPRGERRIPKPRRAQGRAYSTTCACVACVRRRRVARGEHRRRYVRNMRIPLPSLRIVCGCSLSLPRHTLPWLPPHSQQPLAARRRAAAAPPTRRAATRHRRAAPPSRHAAALPRRAAPPRLS